MCATESVASTSMTTAGMKISILSATEEKGSEILWKTYIPTKSEHFLFLYYCISKLMIWVIQRLPLDMRALMRSKGSRLLLGLLVAGTTKFPALQHFLILFVLHESIIRALQGLFYPICGAYALGYTWQMKLAYFHCTGSWWIANKLSEFWNSGGDVDFLCNLCSEERVHMAIRDHCEARKLRPGDIPSESQSEDLDNTIRLMSDYSGSFVTQLYLFGTRHVFEDELEYRMHLMVSCVAHLMDDYVDREEDAMTGQFNFFLHHPLARKFPITYWIRRLHKVREYYQHDPAMLRFIDGTCAVTTLFDSSLYRMVYQSENKYAFENPLRPAWTRSNFKPLSPRKSWGKPSRRDSHPIRNENQSHKKD